MLRFLRNKAGYGLIETIISICVLSTITITSMTLLTNMMSSLEFFRSNVVAQTLATSKVNLLAVAKYDSVASEARAQVDTTYKLDRETVVNEIILGDGTKEKDVTINIYKTGSADTLFTMDYVVAAAGASAGSSIPVGFIGIWSGSAAAIPSGWALCDGTNGTPDLRDRFVVGAGSTVTAYTPNGVGGIAAGYFPVGQKGGEQMHKLTVAEMPKHTHPYSGRNDGYGGDLTGYNSAISNSDSTGYAGGDGAHNTLPPYYALCYIMKL